MSCDWESWSENILLSLPLLSLCRRRSDGSSLGEQRKHVSEGSSVALLWQVPPRRRVCRRCTSKKDWLGADFSGVNQPQVISPPLISAQQVVSWLLLLIHGYFVIWRFSGAAICGPPPAHISDARRSRLRLRIHQRRDPGPPVHLCVLDCLCPSHFSSVLIAAWQNKALLLSLARGVRSWNPWWKKSLNVLWINNQSIVLFTSLLEVY